MKRKDAIQLAMSERAEAYLRMRYAALTLGVEDDVKESDAIAGEPLPEAVRAVLESVCLGCLNRAITIGDWSDIDQMLLGNASAPADHCLH